MRYHKNSDSPLDLARNLSLSLPFDSQLFVLHGRMLNLLARYQQLRFDLLTEANYFHAGGLRRVDLLNCPPLKAVKAAGAANRTCQRYSFCPFCWARLVAGDVYQRFERCLFGNNQVTRKGSRRRNTVSEQYDLLEIAEEYWLDGDAESVVWAEHNNLAHQRRQLRSALGTFYLTTIEPTTDRWRVRPRLLSIISRRTHTLPAITDNVVIQQRWQAPDREMTAQAVGRTCEYPLGLLQGPLSKSTTLLNARAGKRGHTPRLATYHGGLRGK